MTTLLLLAHVGPEAVPAFRAALEGLDVELAPFVVQGLSEAYRTLARGLRGKDGRLLPRLLQHARAARRLDEYSAVLLVSWSAPYALAEELLRDPADVAALRGWIALDSGYGIPTPGIVDLARRARAGEALYWAGYTDVPTAGYASSGDFLGQVQATAGGPQGLFRVDHWAHDPAALTRAHEAGSAAVGAFWRGEHVGALHRGPAFVLEALEALGAAAVSPDTTGSPSRAASPLRSAELGELFAGIPVLRRHVRGGAEVQAWQEQLVAAAAALGRPELDPGPVDGLFGPRTEAATQALQRGAGLLPDGLVSPGTRAALELLGYRDVKPGNHSLAGPGSTPASTAAPGLGPRALAVALGELGQHEVPGPGANPRIVAYHQGVERSGHPLDLGAGDEPAWCAAFVGWCERDIPGALPWRAAVAEVWADAAAAGTTRERGYRPQAGDLAVFGRGGGDPRRGGPGHVARVESVDGVRFTAIGGNEGDAVRRTVRALGDPALVGWVVR